MPVWFRRGVPLLSLTQLLQLVLNLTRKIMSKKSVKPPREFIPEEFPPIKEELIDPIEPRLIDEEDPDIIPFEDPFESPTYKIPPPAEGP
jgi:hypothetical protein